MRLGPAFAALILLALAACSRPAEPVRTPEGQAFQPSSAPPRRKPGLWEQRVSNGDFVQVSRVCLDAATEARLNWWGGQATQDVCEKNLFSARVAGGWQVSSVCDMGSGGKVTTSGVVTGDVNAHYQLTAESSTVGAEAPQMNGIRRMVVDAAWQGPCPADMKPGDMSLPGGIRINLLDMSVRKPTP